MCYSYTSLISPALLAGVLNTGELHSNSDEYKPKNGNATDASSADADRSTRACDSRKLDSQRGIRALLYYFL